VRPSPPNRCVYVLPDVYSALPPKNEIWTRIRNVTRYVLSLTRHLIRGPSHAAASTCNVSFSTKSPPRPNRTQIPRARQKTADPQRLLLSAHPPSMSRGPRRPPSPTGHWTIRQQPRVRRETISKKVKAPPASTSRRAPPVPRGPTPRSGAWSVRSPRADGPDPTRTASAPRPGL